MEKVGSFFRKYSIFIVLAALVIFFTAMNPVFITWDNLINITRQISYLGIGCVGAMCCMLTGGIDLSLGSAVTMNNVLIAYLMINCGVHPVLACLIGIVMNTACGFFNGFVVSSFSMPPMIVTLSTQLILSGAAYLLAKGMPIFGFPEGFNYMGQGYIGPIPVCVLIMLACMLVGAFILNKTCLGRRFFAVGSNAQAAGLSGINVKYVKQLAYSLSGFFGGIAGIVLLSRTNSAQVTAGTGFEFDVISALVVGGVSIEGGTGKMSRALIGVLIMGVINNGFVIIGVSTYMQSVIKGGILLLAVGFDCIQRARKQVK